LRDIKVLDPACGSGAFPMGMLLRLMQLRGIVGNSLNNSYELKNEILSCNIYGVDIMPMAVEIARLRAWLSLVLEVDYKPIDHKHNFNIKALPNLDFKFICANSLIDSGYDDFLDKLKDTRAETAIKLSIEIQKLENIRQQYFDPNGDRQRKYELRDEFVDTKKYIKIKFAILKKSWNLEDFLNKIDDWNPFDDGHSSSFFSPAWMFGIKDGFDVVIGNPPYVEHKKLKYISAVFKKNYLTYSGTADLYVYFFENGIKNIKENGVLVYITSNKFLRTSYGENLRNYITTFNINEIIDFTDVHVFEALVASCILSISKSNNSNNKVKVAFANDSLLNFADLKGFVDNNKFFLKQNTLTEKIWQLENETKLNLKEKIENGSVAMSKTGTINICRGVTTGFNPAFIINEEKRKELIKEDKANISVIKPLLQGRNIRKWIYQESNNYLLQTGYDTNIKKDYPIIYDHLKLFKNELEIRADQGVNWWNLRACKYYSEFEKEKIIWGLTADKWAFAYDNKNHYLPSNGYILISKNIPLKYLLALMNSNLMEFYFGFMGIMTAGGAYTLKHETISLLPIKETSDKVQKPFIEVVDKILAITKSSDYFKNPVKKEEVKECERQIDVLVYKLYNLTYEEVKVIDPTFWLSEKEYEKFEV
ncbi:MAG: TaqI-like C-terminal specificity domain-containing protein, partial [Nitrospirota bacterium]